MQFQINACLFYNIANNISRALFLGIVWNVTLFLKAKALKDVGGLNHLALALIALVLALKFAAWLRLP